MTSEGDLTILSIHDLHLGHDSTPSEEIVLGLGDAFSSSDPFIKTLDYLFYPGDVFDKLLHLPHHGIPTIREEFRRQLQIAQHYGISVRVLEGTPSHDWKQSSVLKSVAEEMGFTGDLIYVDKLSVEITPKGHSILYIPDEWRSDNTQTYKEAVEAIRAAGLTQVDFCLFHGQFEFQLPGLNLPCHDSALWNPLVKYFIFAGHIHTPSQSGKILVAGSFDRLRHNEDHPKGHLRVTIKPTGESIVDFVENVRAKTYLTINCLEQTVESVRDWVVPQIKDLRVGSFVRLHGHPLLGLRSLVKSFEEDYPHFRWAIKVEKESLKERTAAADINVKFTPITLTTDNLPTLVAERIRLRNLPPIVLDKALQLLRDYK